MNIIRANRIQAIKGRNVFKLVVSTVCLLMFLLPLSPTHASVRADFNGDGYDDLAVGVPGEDIGGINSAGAVHVLYGNASGSVSSNQLWHLNVAGVQLNATAGDRFGSAITAGDFDGDGYTDLAIGIPYKDSEKGQVLVLYGGLSGLSAGGNQVWNQGNLADVRENGDRFGASLTSGDFDADGYSDLAIGVPMEDFPDEGPASGTGPVCGICPNAGIVNVVYGSAGGLNAAGNELWHQDRGSADGWVEWQDCAGTSVASGDFNGDGADDLAIGAVCEHTGGGDVTGRNMGAVSIYKGTHGGGLTGTNAVYLRQFAGGVVGFPNDKDAFGFALAVGDFNNDHFEDLAIGVPGEDVDCGTSGDNGAVAVFYGNASGVGLSPNDASRNELWCRNSSGILGSGPGRWGYALAAGDFDGDGFADVAIGAPLDTLDSVTQAGSINVLYGSASRLRSAGNQLFSQNTSGLLDNAEPYDWFGHTLAAVDFNGNGITDLAISVPFENLAGGIQAGAVHILFGASGSGLTVANNRFVHQDSSGVSDQSEARDEFGGRLVPQLYQTPWPNTPPDGPVNGGGGNEAPILNPIGPRSVEENQTLTINISATDSDGPPPLVLSISNKPVDATFVDNGDGSGQFSWTPTTGDASGSPYSVTFTATDDGGAGLSDSETVSITVVPAGGSTYAQWVSSAADRSNPLPLADATVQGIIYVFVLPENNIDKVAFFLDGVRHQTEGIAPYDFAGTAADGNAKPFDTNSLSNGNHVISAKITLVGGSVETISANIVVANSGNQPPTLALIGSKSVEENQFLTFMVSATDDDGPPPLVLSTSNLPQDANFIDLGDGTGEFSWTPLTGTAAGSPYNVTFIATDDGGAGLSDSETISITVFPAGGSTYAQWLSTSPDRGNPIPLDGASVQGVIYVFVQPTAGIQKVGFFLDGVWRQAESFAPYDFAGTASNGDAKPFDTNSISNGGHEIKARITLQSGSIETIVANIVVAN